MAREKCPRCGNERNSANLHSLDLRWPNNAGGTYCGECLSEFLGVALKDITSLYCHECGEYEQHIRDVCLLCKALNRFGEANMMGYQELLIIVLNDLESGGLYGKTTLAVLELHAPETAGECCRPEGALECGSCAGNFEGHRAIWPCESYKAIEGPVRVARDAYISSGQSADLSN